MHPSVPTRSCTEHAASRRWRAARAESGAYVGQRGDSRGVPRADVRVERRREGECLRAEPPAVDADGKAPARFGADAWAPNRTRTRAHTDAHVRRVCTPIPTSSQQYTYTYMYIRAIYVYNTIYCNIMNRHIYVCICVCVCGCVYTYIRT